MEKMKKLILILTLFLCSCISQRQLTEEEREDLQYEEYWKSIEEQPSMMQAAATTAAHLDANLDNYPANEWHNEEIEINEEK